MSSRLAEERGSVWPPTVSIRTSLLHRQPVEKGLAALEHHAEFRVPRNAHMTDLRVVVRKPRRHPETLGHELLRQFTENWLNFAVPGAPV
ncbi:hypothetical protein [Streptomyces sp. NPDC057253]|uniref:hypothetical protein n=1 Tax=Streptomyces sp. NPDC057253 TaxID=3346069 RepID=UPI003625E896